MGTLASGQGAGDSTAGARAGGLAVAPARFTARTTSPANEKNLALPPQPHVRKKLEPRLDRDSRRHFEWLADG